MGDCAGSGPLRPLPTLRSRLTSALYRLVAVVEPGLACGSLEEAGLWWGGRGHPAWLPQGQRMLVISAGI